MSSGKNLALLTTVAIAAAAAVFSAKRPGLDRVEPADEREPGVVTRRLPSPSSRPANALHVYASAEDHVFEVPTVSTAGTPDVRVGTQFAPSSAGAYGRSFNPAAALLESTSAAEAKESDEGPELGSVAAAPGSVAAAPGKRRHVVVDGDTLGRLAARYLGSSDRYLEIYAVNRGVLASPDLLPIGATLEIPSVAADAQADHPPTASSSALARARAPRRDGLVPVPAGSLTVPAGSLTVPAGSLTVQAAPVLDVPEDKAAADQAAE